MIRQKVDNLNLTTEIWLFLLFLIQTIVSLIDYFTTIPLLTLFDIIVLVISLRVTLKYPCSCLNNVYQIYKNFIIRISLVCFMIVFLYGGVKFLRSTLLVLFLIPGKCFVVKSAKSETTQTEVGNSKTELDTYGTRKRLMSETLKDNERWLDLIDQGYFVCNKNLELLYSNKKAEQLMNEIERCFNVFTKRLVDIQRLEKSLNSTIKELIASGIEGNSVKGEFSIFQERKDNSSIFTFTAQLLWNYKATIWKLCADNVLIIMRKNNQSDTLIVSKNIDNAINATLSHELKTLLNIITGGLSLLEDVIDKGHRHVYKFVISSSHILAAKINDLFDYIQIQNHKFSLHISYFQVESLVKDVRDISKWIAKQKHLEFSTTIEPTVPETIRGDYIRLKQVLLNLLSKAIEYTEFGTIMLRVKVNKKKLITFQVKSLGVGMHQSLLSKIKSFSPKLRKQKYRHVGNGVTENLEEMYLEIALWISNEMNTKIDIKSCSGKDKGNSQFSFSLPNAIITEEELKGSQNQMEYIARKDGALFNGMKAMKEDDLNIPNEQKLSARELVHKYLFSAKSTPEFNRKCQFSPKASLITQCYLGNDKTDMQNEGLLETKKLIEVRNNEKKLSKSKINAKKLSDMDPKVFLEIKTEYSTLKSNDKFKNIIEEKKEPKEVMSNLELPRLNEFASVERPGMKPAQRRERKRRTTLQDGINVTHVRTLKKTYVDDNNSCKILITDDNMSNRFILKSMLHKCGLNSIEAQNGLDAVNAVQKYLNLGNIKDLLLIFMDLQMPVMNGIEATEAILELCNSSGVVAPPIIGVSSDSLEEDRRKFLGAGINEFVSKPLDKGKVESILSTYIKRKIL